jgi:ribosome assembly protein RRB1
MLQVWQPGVDGIEDGEELQFDPTAYDCLHAFHLGWPCLRSEHLLPLLGCMVNIMVFCVGCKCIWLKV